MILRYTPLFASLLLFTGHALAQCDAGEVQVTIAITTDAYGYETYWQLVPGTNACGDGTIFEGGNPLVGCDGGGLQNQEPGGYGNDMMFTEGPWCLVEGAQYTIHMVDDWGDAQAGVEVFVDGVSAMDFGVNEAASSVLTFTAQGPVARDMAVTRSYTGLFAHVGETVHVRGTVVSYGFEPVTSFDLSYSIDGGAPVSTTVTGVTLNAGDVYEFKHDIPWLPSSEGNVELVVSVTGINGSSDLNTFNDQLGSLHVISPEIPDLAADYLAAEPVVTTIATSDQDILVPRDLSFHPESSRNQLWVINKDTEASGGSTVTFYGAGEPDGTHEWRKDVNSWHFMSLPTGIAMGDNDCFATSPGVFDANHNGGDPFTGPSLWSADTAIYCRFYGGLGSHLDMLHRNPMSQGIAHEYWNRYWVVDGYVGDIVMNDFRTDHGPGNDYHGNGIIRRYAEFTITRDPADHIVSHNVMDKSTGWLYVVDHGGQRVLRMNVNTGAVSGPATEWDFEPVVEYTTVTGYEWEVIITEGLVEPAGIEIVGTHLYVSDHSNGDIIMYDVSGGPVVEVGRIHTNAPGLMGITVGPDGRIWGVNATNHTLLRMDPQDPTSVEETRRDDLRCWPNPSDDRLLVERPTALDGSARYTLMDAAGRVVITGSDQSRTVSLSTADLASGTYLLEFRSGAERRTALVAVAH
jgi:Secretion system C-terminal sorting domain